MNIKETLKTIKPEIEAAIEAILVKHGMTGMIADIGKGKFTTDVDGSLLDYQSSNFKIYKKGRVTLAEKNALNKAGLPLDIIGKYIKVAGNSIYKVIGINHRSPKYILSVLDLETNVKYRIPALAYILASKIENEEAVVKLLSERQAVKDKLRLKATQALEINRVLSNY